MDHFTRLLQSKAGQVEAESSTAGASPRFPVEGFPIKFVWQDAWADIFDEQVSLLREDIARARAEDRIVVYLSCPVSGRGGGFAATNVEIANHTQRRLMAEWGHKFWILNPAQYQLESKEGTGLIMRHAKKLNMTEEDVAKLPRVTGGDYMRMWTRVLVDDGDKKLGRHFDAYYFLGPSDVRAFLTQGGALSLTAGIEEFFARQFAMDADFRDAFSLPSIEWRADWATTKDYSEDQRRTQSTARSKWDQVRMSFVRYYGVKAGAAFSLGSHDEWNIFKILNDLRLAERNDAVPDLLAGFFDGRQIDPGAAATEVAPGYAAS